MKLNIYGVKDDVTGEFVFTFNSQNDGTMKRVVKSSLLTKEPNVFTRDLKDKKVYKLGEFETITGEIKALSPLYAFSVSEVRMELIEEIKIAKQEAGDPNPNANEVADDD